MVSFQCDGCSDVVKKPKLDQHYGRCGASVSCIDCSKTFHSPAEFKGHTSCISEAEKYQGELYQGVKHGDQSWNKNVRGGFRGRSNARGWGGDGRGGFQGRPYRGSGANEIDLGEKVRSFGASPASSSPSASPVSNAAEAAPQDTDKQDTAHDDKKGKEYEKKETHGVTTAAKRKAPVESSSEIAPSSEGTGTIEHKKKKKKVYSDVESSSAEVVLRAAVATDEPSPTRKEKSRDEDKDKKNKDKKNKDKKDKMSKEKALGTNTEVATANEETEKIEKDAVEGTDPVSKKKKSKKSKSSSAES